MPDKEQASRSADQRAALLQKWLSKKSFNRALEIPHCVKEGPLPLSFAQERIWFLQQFMPDSPSYNLPIAFRMAGELDIPNLERSFLALLQRHSVLQTTFSEIDGKPVQVITPACEFKLSITDLQQFPQSEKEEKLSHLTTEIYKQLFDLVNGPLLRATLFILAEQEFLLLITVHHIISDGWSNGILIEELGKHYEAFLSNSDPLLGDCAYQYADIVCWQRKRFQEGELENELVYWKRQLDGASSTIQLPLDRPRPAVQSSEGGMHHFRLPEKTVTGLQLLSRQEGVTSVMLFLAALKTLLFRYTGQDDLLVGVPAFNRHRTEEEGLLGLFVNTLAIRTSLSGNPNFREILRRVRKSTLGAYENQEYPFEKLVEVLRPERNTSISPLFQVMLSIGAGAETHVQWPGLALFPYDVNRPYANFDLTLEIFEHADGPHLAFIFRTDLFDRSTIERMAEHFCLILEGCITQLETPVAFLPVIPTSEREQILFQWNDTAVEFPPPNCLHSLFEAQVIRTPDTTAVTYENEHMNYEALNQRANQLAHFLSKRGVGPDVVVGIAVERSIEMIIGLLGILKAGGAYLPLDPTYPQERLLYMLDDAQVTTLLTQEQLVSKLPRCSASVVCLDRDWQDISYESIENPAKEIPPDSLAYAIYTSGSTGKPKGAMNQHGAICNRIRWMQKQYKLGKDDAVLQKTPFCFDVSVWEFFWPLVSGARLVIARPEGHKDATYLVDVIVREAITTLHFVPSMLQNFLEEPGVEHCTSLRQTMCSGEALSYDLQERFFKRSKAELHNLYGPTEAAVDVTFWACERLSKRRNVPLGRPIANTQIYILDQYLQPAPIGVAGELYIGGIQVGRGYLNRVELTKEKFILDPFSKNANARLYKTGDLARYLADGNIEYLGRIDHQVKIRGLRIELEEIEAILLQHRDVGECVVVVKEIVPGDQRLVAYLTTKRDESLDMSDIRSFLGSKLPAYMVPGMFVTLDALPLTSNGKLDRKALPDPPNTCVSSDKEFIASSTDIEHTITEVWQDVLHISQVGIQDNFFELGGHSLLVTQVRKKLQDKLGIELSIIDMFRFTTVQALSQHISGARPEQPSLQPASTRAQLQRQAMQRKRLERK